MRKILTTLGLIIVSLASSATSLVAKGDSAYINDEFSMAINYYKQAIATEGVSAELYYNLGNAYYRSGELGNSIVCYERALRLSPNDEDIRANLEFVNSRIKDKSASDQTFLAKTLDVIITMFHANTWAIIAIVAFSLFLLAVGLYIFSSEVMIRKVGFFGALLLLLLAISSAVFAVIGTENATTQKYAIIIQPSTMLSTSPREPKNRGEEAILLHEGTKIEIFDSVENKDGDTKQLWYDVRYSGKNRAWIKASAIEKI